MGTNRGGFGIGAVILGAIAVWVVVDALRRGTPLLEAIAWGLGVFFCCLLGLPLYLVSRNSDASRT